MLLFLLLMSKQKSNTTNKIIRTQKGNVLGDKYSIAPQIPSSPKYNKYLKIGIIGPSLEIKDLHTIRRINCTPRLTHHTKLYK
jgi:hypothetical protein